MAAATSGHPFTAHLVAVLSIYELGPGRPGAAPLPRYDGPRDWQTDAVERALGRVAARMYAAEAELAALKSGET
ncbi:hypothetical protein BDV93DRAFT_393765, partial [Ceratobasidium sp. AG-I]